MSDTPMTAAEFADFWPQRWKTALVANEAFDRIALSLRQREEAMELVKAFMEWQRTIHDLVPDKLYGRAARLLGGE